MFEFRRRGPCFRGGGFAQDVKEKPFVRMEEALSVVRGVNGVVLSRVEVGGSVSCWQMASILKRG